MAHTPNERHDEIILELLCCVMVVDKTASATEKTHIHTILSEDGSKWTTAEVNQRVKKFIERVQTDGIMPTLDAACDKASALPVDRIAKLVQDCISLAKDHSEFHERERKAIGRILQKFPQIQMNGFSTQQEETTSTFELNMPEDEWELPGSNQSSESQQDGKVGPGDHGWVWVVASVISTVWFVAAVMSPDRPAHRTLIDRGWVMFLPIIVPLITAYLIRRSLRRREIERADRREMVIYVESAYQHEHEVRDIDGEPTGRMRGGAYEFRVARYGCVRVPSSIYHKVRSRTWVVVVASTVYGLKITKVIRTARPGEDY